MSYETYANERILALQAEVDSWRAAQEECHELHTSAAHGTQSIVEYLGVLRQRIHDINNEESDIELSSGDADILLACVQIAGEFGAIIADGIRKMSQDAV
jgi:hypothetical protein